MTWDEDPQFRGSSLITTGLRDVSHLLLQKLACLLIMIETDNGQTDTQPPVALPSTCPLPAASRFQQMPELIRAAYVSPRSPSAILKHVLPEDVVSLSINANKLISDIFYGILNDYYCSQRSSLFFTSSLICWFLSRWCDLHLQLLLVRQPFAHLSPAGTGRDAYLMLRN